MFSRGELKAWVLVTLAFMVLVSLRRLARLYKTPLEERPAFGQRLLLWIASAFLVFGPAIAWGAEGSSGILFYFLVPAFAMLIFDRLCLEQGRWVAPVVLWRNAALLFAAFLLAWSMVLSRPENAWDLEPQFLTMAMLWWATLAFLVLGALSAWFERRPWVERGRAWFELGHRPELLAAWPLVWKFSLFAYGQVGLAIHGEPLSWWGSAVAYAIERCQSLEGAWNLMYHAMRPLARWTWALWALVLGVFVGAGSAKRARRLLGLAAVAFGLAVFLHGAVAAGFWAQIRLKHGAVEGLPAEPTISAPKR